MAPTIQTAMDLHRQGRLNEAETLYRNLLAKSPSQFEPLHLFGILKLQQGNLPEALTLISKAVEINPSALDARSNLVAVLLNLLELVVRKWRGILPQKCQTAIASAGV